MANTSLASPPDVSASMSALRASFPDLTLTGFLARHTLQELRSISEEISEQTARDAA
jgi:hypothetical protein